MSESQYIQAWLRVLGCGMQRHPDEPWRNCGDTDHLTPTLMITRSLSGDVGAVVSISLKLTLETSGLIGYSMGGNLVLKLAGEWGNRAPLCAVAAVCPAVDLAAGSDALMSRSTRIRMAFPPWAQAALSAKGRFPSRIYDTRGLGSIRSVRQFDDKIVARHCAFAMRTIIISALPALASSIELRSPR